MPVFDPQILASDCGGAWHGWPEDPICGFAIDTRQLRSGDMFVALRTARRDGHEFIPEARAAGASAGLVSRDLPGAGMARLHVADTLSALQALARAHRRRYSGRVLAVTGSAGKTSTKDLLAALLGEPGAVLATEGNLNNHLGVPLTLLRIDPARHGAAVVEAGINAPNEMDVLGAITLPDVVIITTVAAAHLEGLGSLDRVAEEKARLAAHLVPGGVAIFPAHCLRFPPFRNLASASLVAVAATEARQALPSRARAVRYSVRHEPASTGVTVAFSGLEEEFRFRRLTPGMASNAALALVAALHLGLSAEDLRARIARWRPAALRGEVIEVDGRLVYLDCYNANPASMLDALEGFLPLATDAAPRLFVVGCMEELGEETTALHHAVGARWPLREQDLLIIFGQQAEAFAAGVHSKTPGARVFVNPDRSLAETSIRSARGPVFVKGSRAYRLETLVANLDLGEHHERETAA